MKLGAVFPQTEIGIDPIAIKDYAQAVEEMGFDYLLTYEHILGAKRESYPEQSFIYTHKDMFHEPFTLFSYLSAFTTTLEFVPGVLVLTQRNTPLVAKQAVQVSLFSHGRLRLGVGVGWNKVEIDALGFDPGSRGKRIDEQIRLLKALWESPLIQFEGDFHRIHDLGLNPLPPHPIPVWVGGMADVVLKRAAELGDGWMPASAASADPEPYVEKLRAYMEDYDRDPDDFGIDMTFRIGKQDQDTWHDYVERRQKLGMTHMRVYTMKMGNKTVDDHLKVLAEFMAFAKDYQTD